MMFLRHLLPLSALVLAAADPNKQIPLGGKDVSLCEHPDYKVHIVSRSPLVMYIENFITGEERAHLREITKDTFAHSEVTSSAGAGNALHRVRTSQSTRVDSGDPVVRCIEDRALAFQGFDVSRDHLEPLQLVKYAPGEHYHYHTDWFTDVPRHANAALGGNRISSFFAYITAPGNNTKDEDRITGGGTNFPLLRAPHDPRWCQWIDCDEEWEEGVSFRPVEGNAVYWENLLENGMGDQRVLHAGLPVITGSKIGMNIWTRQGPLDQGIRGSV
ncbi:uncharacterized protein E0L32_006334 [Thyridium curvatum]|uniref:Fe2OG dioxygenase domain-containing protein n=1 Tax=Thyridium curvatum TaxID=1093900 RepID=A0A507B8G4_9PEZI|nr:uncharacterized protein E0L32_006334 [Thyridium curvatum]TPX13361.1 hypothetical protein E0L32_006334 [Thyridium curvatum]